MSSFSQHIRTVLGVVPEIDPKVEVDRRVQFLVDYCLTAGASGFVFGISGGQDSTLAGKLAQLAVEELRRRSHNAEFHAVRLPYRVQHDEDDAQAALDFIGADHEITMNIAGGTDGMAEEFHKALGKPMKDFDKGNVKARMRMIAQYAIGAENGLLVIGADHAAEAVTGFYTKFGDGGADVLPLAGLTKRQGRAMLEHLGAPEKLYTKVPTADLLDENPGETDESSLGLTYEQIDDYLEGKDVPDDVAERIERRFRSTEHKRRMPPGPDETWWIRH
jgi:NAD+ synthase